jgi:hypothetical protein
MFMEILIFYCLFTIVGFFVNLFVGAASEHPVPAGMMTWLLTSLIVWFLFIAGYEFLKFAGVIV